MKKLFSFLLFLLGLTAQAQVTFKITAVPANTPANATIYMAGSFNSWNPASAAHLLTRNADGSYQITLPAATGTIEYKFTRGAWASVETTASNGQVPNRTFTFGSSPGPVLHQVLNWEDLAGGTPGGGQSTAAANVSVISTTFQMPQLGRTRRVWLYLPPGYATSGRRYPVLYMQDGQNVFDNLTAFAGEWGVDETLNLLQTNGQDPTGCIVVAIDNGGGSRLDEYSPWNNPQNGGGQGDLYLDFLVQTLKPYIDTNYRTLATRENTGIAGSSMGALIATYAALRHPTVFGKVGVFSPAYWFASQPLFEYVHQHPANPNTRFYFVSGTTESTSMVPNMAAMRDSLLRGGVPAANLSFNPRADGQHAEWFWNREFPAAYNFLFAPATATPVRHSQRLSASVYPNPAAQELRIAFPVSLAEAKLEITDARGRTVLRTAVHHGEAVNLRGLAAGLYLSRITAGNEVKVVKFAKE
ncbi:T9SS type A sorting domain-containing protein [Hymenobacter sp. BT683]|uniref:T9SS type A sorting domain-containing protein n=1 Tax=Hymenobacter jeongseonensis TaxID=2791027 RepID=A0ABS0ILB4_9BACT|nr:alpha/beta hydrolase-fold protein [Hymenobacter jeongseonensis]MBF9239154.1 T9SS type A sorting domain-containing protein [Hymenobacter jeongseonensis]